MGHVHQPEFLNTSNLILKDLNFNHDLTVNSILSLAPHYQPISSTVRFAHTSTSVMVSQKSHCGHLYTRVYQSHQDWNRIYQRVLSDPCLTIPGLLGAHTAIRTIN